MNRLVMSAAVAACVLAASQGASAQAVFKCKAADGSAYFTDKACPAGSTRSVEESATQAAVQSRIDAVDPRKQSDAQEAYEHDMAAGAVAAQSEREERAQVARRNAAISASVANANDQEYRNQMDNAARVANFDADTANSQGLPTIAAAPLHERSNYHRQQVTRDDLNALDQKHGDKRRTLAIQAAAVQKAEWSRVVVHRNAVADSNPVDGDGRSCARAGETQECH